MLRDRRTRLKEAAVHALRTGKPEETLQTAEYLAGEDPSDAEVFQLQGLALAKLDRGPEATQKLREATRLEPENPKHAFNLAGHLANQGQRDEALEWTRRALELEPGYEAAQRLLDVLEGRTEAVEEVPHLLTWMRGRERTWDGTAFALMALGGILAVLMLTNFPASPVEGGVGTAKMVDVELKTDPLSQATVVLYIMSTLSTFLWMLTDIVDRRRKFTWLVPVTVCGALGFNVLPLALYYFVGRKSG
jgi:tetratricopeptide (TPR) repeat protein